MVTDLGRGVLHPVTLPHRQRPRTVSPMSGAIGRAEPSAKLRNPPHVGAGAGPAG